MTREELKEHCERQVQQCEFWARARGEEPGGKVYEEHKLILELLKQESFMNKPCVSSGVCEHDKMKTLNKIRAEIEEAIGECSLDDYNFYSNGLIYARNIIDKYSDNEHGE